MNDRFRKTSHNLLPENVQRIVDMKTKAEELEKFFHISSREMSIALTNLEQAIMWAVKAIILHDQKMPRELSEVKEIDNV